MHNPLTIPKPRLQLVVHVQLPNGMVSRAVMIVPAKAVR